MTLPERLARKALPCLAPPEHPRAKCCSNCERRDAVEDAIRKVIQLALNKARWADDRGRLAAPVIRRLLTDEKTP